MSEERDLLEQLEQRVRKYNSIRSDWLRSWLSKARAELIPRSKVRERVDDLWNVLDRALGDSDIDWFESDDDMREEEPVQWVAKELALLLSEMDPTDD